MITLSDFSEDTFPLICVKGFLCISEKEGTTRPVKCAEKKKLPAERGGREDLGNKLPIKK